MPSTDRNDLVPAQEKLEWVTPKILLMDGRDTESKNQNQLVEQAPLNHSPGGIPYWSGPS